LSARNSGVLLSPLKSETSFSWTSMFAALRQG